MKTMIHVEDIGKSEEKGIIDIYFADDEPSICFIVKMNINEVDEFAKDLVERTERFKRDIKYNQWNN